MACWVPMRSNGMPLLFIFLFILLAGLAACGKSGPSARDLNEEFGFADNGKGSSCLLLSPVSDPALREAILQATGVEPGQSLTSAQLTSVTEFSAEDLGIMSLDGIHCLPNMSSTFIAGNSIHDLSPLGRVLTDIHQLDISRNVTADLRSLAGLDKLRYLWLVGCEISELEALPELEFLNSLYLAENQITSLEFVPDIPSLRRLDLSDNRLVSLSGPPRLDLLETLELRNNRIADVSGLQSLPTLRTLDLAGNQITDLSPIAALTELQSLDLGANPLPPSADLGDLDQLLSLRISDAGLSSLAFVSRLSRLETLDVNNNVIVDLVPLRTLANLQDVDLSANAISDLTPLADNLGLGIGDVVDVTQNPIDCTTQQPNLDALRLRGVVVQDDCSGDAGAGALDTSP